MLIAFAITAAGGNTGMELSADGFVQEKRIFACARNPQEKMPEPLALTSIPWILGVRLKKFFHDKPLFSAQAPIFSLGKGI